MSRQLRFALTVVLALLLVPTGGIEAKKKKKKRHDEGELINFMLTLDYSHWLSGAIARMASAEEIERFMALVSDSDASEFVDEFWRQRDPHPDTVRNPVRELFDERSAEADKLYSEAARTGRKTDRGTIFILYGEPDETRYEISSNPRNPPVETWAYSDDAEAGLDAAQPESLYHFARQGEITTFYERRPGERLQGPEGSRASDPSRLPGGSRP